MGDGVIGDDTGSTGSTARREGPGLTGNGGPSLPPYDLDANPYHPITPSPHHPSPIPHHPRTALVTGGAGLIGSHIVDGALAAGGDVRILDTLQRQPPRKSNPDWVPGEADFTGGDARNRRTWERALDGIDIV